MIDVKKLEELCNACKGKYMRISAQRKGYKYTEFAYSPHIVISRRGDIWVCTESLITITIHTPYQQNHFTYLHNTIDYCDGKMIRVEEGMRIYWTPYKGSAVKRLVREYLNSRIKFL